MKQVLVLGGSGYLGTGICAVLRDSCAQPAQPIVFTYVNSKPELDYNWRRYEFPVDDPRPMLDSFNGDLVIIAARIAGSDGTLVDFEQKFEALIQFLKSKTGKNGRLVYVSSDAV